MQQWRRYDLANLCQLMQDLAADSSSNTQQSIKQNLIKLLEQHDVDSWLQHTESEAKRHAEFHQIALTWTVERVRRALSEYPNFCVPKYVSKVVSDTTRPLSERQDALMLYFEREQLFPYFLYPQICREGNQDLIAFCDANGALAGDNMEKFYAELDATQRAIAAQQTTKDQRP